MFKTTEAGPHKKHKFIYFNKKQTLEQNKYGTSIAQGGKIKILKTILKTGHFENID